MIKVSIPGRKDLSIENIVFDFNGTLATEGKLDASAYELIHELKKSVNIYILTSDTYGTVKNECHMLGVEIITLSGESCGAAKKAFVEKLGAKKTVSVGNGQNDKLMFEASLLAVAILGEEGCCVNALTAADIAVKNIKDALMLFANPTRLTATLRA